MSKPKKKPGGNPAKRSPVPPPQMTPDHQFRLAKMKVQFFGSGVLMVLLCLVILACWPIAHQFAGESTALNVTISVSLLGVAALVSVILGGWGNHQKRRADRLDRRNKRLGAIIHELQDRVVKHGGDPNVHEDVDALLTEPAAP